jgi:hypothetical protein
MTEILQTLEECAATWLASYQPSFEGQAIISKDFICVDGNDQFYKILEITPGDIIGKSIHSNTCNTTRRQNQENAILVSTKKIDGYQITPATFEFPGKESKKVALIVNGVYSIRTTEFIYFLFKIMNLEEENEQDLVVQSPPLINNIMNFFEQKNHLIIIKWVIMGFLLFMASIGSVNKEILQIFNNLGN